MGTPYSIFVSHSHEDNIWCRAYVGALQAGGMDVWYDERNLGYGRLMDEIERELSARPVFSVVLSPAAISSQWVRREVTAAIELHDHQPGRIILPVMAAPCEVPLLWRAYKYISGPSDMPLQPNDAAARVLQLLGPDNTSEAPASTPYDAAERELASAKALAAAGRQFDALRACDNALAIDPQHVAAFAQKADIFGNLRRYEESLIMLDRALAINPGSADLLCSRGIMLQTLGRSAEAYQVFEAALRIDTNSVRAWAGRGGALYGLGRYKEARRDIERALSIDNHSGEIWSNLGATCHAMKDYHAALKAFDQALRLEPRNAGAWANKAGTLFYLKRYADALALCDHAIGLDPMNATAWDNKIEMLKGMGRIRACLTNHESSQMTMAAMTTIAR